MTESTTPLNPPVCIRFIVLLTTAMKTDHFQSNRPANDSWIPLSPLTHALIVTAHFDSRLPVSGCHGQEACQIPDATTAHGTSHTRGQLTEVSVRLLSKVRWDCSRWGGAGLGSMGPF